MSLFDSLLDLATSTVKIAAAPVDVVVTVAAEAIKPIADVVEDLAEDFDAEPSHMAFAHLQHEMMRIERFCEDMLPDD